MIREHIFSHPVAIMGRTPDSDRYEKLVGEASDWFARLRAEDATEDDRCAFIRWKSQSPAHHDAYESVRLLWDSMAQPAGAWPEIDLQSLERDRVNDLSPRRSRSAMAGVFRTVGMATMVAAVAVAAALWGPDVLQRWQSDYSTSAGEHREVQLSDGSTVLLNTASALALGTWDHERVVKILKGEAAFSVAADSTKPFIVKAGAGEVRVVGTKFSIRTWPGRTTVTVTEGVVTVGTDAESDTVQVRAGEEVSYGGQGMGAIVKADPMRSLAWQRGQLVFTMEPLSAVIEELNRYHSGAIMVVNPSLKTRMVSGVFATDDPVRVISAVTRTLHVRSFSLTDRFVFLY
ncbi:Protein FecR, ferric citrate sensor [Nitrospira sp. KM1]|uniref:FecR family protein n=1 Tax=Nitrospira sp. KM1 TaxID=1936990 RepID=UPI0013A737AB|nr:FecR family protein [Nitrospira sp. KM1]BCA56625.1 Protein FecR, ferric citrate sensor [Nitrospira sp. KM1]